MKLVVRHTNKNILGNLTSGLFLWKEEHVPDKRGFGKFNANHVL